jgi:hypothetical protein
MGFLRIILSLHVPVRASSFENPAPLFRIVLARPWVDPARLASFPLME